MKERGPWKIWIFSLLLAGNLYIPIAECQSYGDGGARGDEGESPQSLGFSGVVTRHDGYVKGETPTIPQTSFSCSAQPHNPGLYADMETQCQVYHVCFEDRQESFLCGPGTNFNQRILACDFWYNFDCQDSPSFYGVNADIGKVPDANTIFTPGQTRVPQAQQPSIPSYPRQPEQPPSVGSYPPRVSIPPPPRNQPHVPSIQPQPPNINIQRPETPVFQPQPEPPRVQPQPPRIQPQPPRIQPQPPRIQPQPPRNQPQPPRIQPQPPRIQPQPPRIQPQQPSYQPQQPSYQPQQPSYQPQQPSYQPQQPSYQPQPPAFIPQPRPEQPQTAVKPQYPSQPSGHGSVNRQPSRQRPSIQQEEDTGYQFDRYNPPKPISLPPPPPPHPQTPRPAFPPVVSPPRVSRPPLTPPVIRQPEGSVSRPRIPVTATRPEFHPDSNLKGSTDFRPPQQPRIPQPSRPVGTGYPSYPVPQRPVTQRPIPQRPVSRPSERPSYVPPPAIQQEHVDPESVQSVGPKQPSRPSTAYVPPPPPPRPAYVPPPPPPPPVQQEVTNVGIKEPQRPSRPPYVPPPAPQPPVAPSVIREQQKPASRPSSRPQVSVGSRQPPQRPKPVFPPPSDHPNSNIKGGPGYQQPPPQIPRFEPTRISRPSSPQGGIAPPVRPRPESISAVKPAGEKRPITSVSGAYKPPQQERIKKPSEPPKEIYQPPIQVIDHPRSEIKGSDYREPVASQQPQRIKSPSTSVSGVKLPQGGGYQQPQVQRPRAPIVVSRPQPPSLPATTIKKVTPVDSQLYEKPRPQPPSPPRRVKQPSQSQVQRTTQPRFPSPQPINHPNANVKGGSSYPQSRPQARPQSRRPPSPPTSPSTSYEQKTTSTGHRQPAACGSPRGDCGSVQQQVIQQEDYKPQRISGIKTASPSSVKTANVQQRPHSVSHQSVQPKQPNPNYEGGASYTRGPETYPKPEFGQPSSPHQPISTPSRSSQITKQGLPSQNTITHAEVKPAYQRPSTGSGFGTGIRPDYPQNEVPGHQPPHQPQVFPHRDNPDHPNESLKGSGAYRPPPPAGFQAAASEVNEQQAAAQPEPVATSLLGDIGAE